MKAGTVQQIGTPQDIYARPYNVFVSTFIGHSNLYYGTVKTGKAPSVRFRNGYTVEMPNLADSVSDGQNVIVSVRPEEFSRSETGLECKIVSRTFLGKYTNYFLEFAEGMCIPGQPGIEFSQDLGHADIQYRIGDTVVLKPNAAKINVFTEDMTCSLIRGVTRFDEA